MTLAESGVSVQLGLNSIIVTFQDEHIERNEYFNIEQAEELWQSLMELCHEFRRQEQIAKVSN